MGVGGLPHAVGGSRQGSRAHAHCPYTWVPACSLQPSLPQGSGSQDSALGALVLPAPTPPPGPLEPWGGGGVGRVGEDPLRRGQRRGRIQSRDGQAGRILSSMQSILCKGTRVTF